MANYILRLEAGAIARKNGTIARKSVTPLDRAAQRNKWKISDDGKTSVFQHGTGRRLEIRRVRRQAQRIGLVGRAKRKYDDAETGYLGNAE